jgi:hypothetical protein
VDTQLQRSFLNRIATVHFNQSRIGVPARHGGDYALSSIKRRIDSTLIRRRPPSLTLSSRPSLIIAFTVVRPKPNARIVAFTDVVSCSIPIAFQTPAVASD